MKNLIYESCINNMSALYLTSGFGSSGNPCDDDYSGVAALSEPETVAFSDAVKDAGSRLKVIATFCKLTKQIIYST